jgi:hypothetical protein
MVRLYSAAYRILRHTGRRGRDPAGVLVATSAAATASRSRSSKRGATASLSTPPMSIGAITTDAEFLRREIRLIHMQRSRIATNWSAASKLAEQSAPCSLSYSTT